MKRKNELVPTYPHNGNLRMYNMFPYRHYVKGKLGIEGMTEYLSEVEKMGYNAVWVNPLQVVGTFKHTHPDGVNTASGSIYAMTDDNCLNPLIFPVPGEITTDEEQQLYRETQLISWTKEAHSRDLVPIFDLVLNHIGLNEGGQESALSLKLRREEVETSLRLILKEKNERWPDVIGLDYYKDTTPQQNMGLNCLPKHLDMNKIDVIFKVLWEPFITRYIVDYGFMGIRIDALTHVPVLVQQRAINLVQKLVFETYNTPAIIVGELMVGNPEAYLPALSACGLTHCLHPCGYYWGFNKEGGYLNDPLQSPFLNQNNVLSSIVMTPDISVDSLSNLVILNDDLDYLDKLLKNTIYIFKKDGRQFCALNINETDICYGKATIFPITELEDNTLLSNISDYVELYKQHDQMVQTFSALSKAYMKKKGQHGESPSEADELERKYNVRKAQFINERRSLKSQLSKLEAQILAKLQSSPILKSHLTAARPLAGGLVGIVGNHDVGTLKAKIMLDIAYARALGKTQDEQKIKKIEEIYTDFKKSIIKAITNTDELMSSLRSQFELSHMDQSQLYVDLNLRMREKIFIESMMCSGGWYSLGGDEFGMCHKPEVFIEFALSARVGSSLTERRDSPYQHHDFRSFIHSINSILVELPTPTPKDKASLHYVVLENEVFGETSANILFMVLRYSEETKEYYLLGHCKNGISSSVLLEKIVPLLPKELTACDLRIINSGGDIQSFRFLRDGLLSSILKVEPELNAPLMSNVSISMFSSSLPRNNNQGAQTVPNKADSSIKNNFN